jgi:outer membrane protein OmpA-like peptidoglycan-associated protein
MTMKKQSIIFLLAIQSLCTVGVFAQNLHKELRFDGGYQYNWTGAGYQSFGLEPPLPSSNFVTFRFIDGGGEAATGGLSYLFPLNERLRLGGRLGLDSRRSNLVDYSLAEQPNINLYINYLTFEPLIEYAIMKNVGLQFRPILALNTSSSFEYFQENARPPVRIAGRELTDIPTLSYGFALGTNYRFSLDKRNQWHAIPFIEGSWLFNQRSANAGQNQNPLTDVLSTISLRVGASIAFSFGTEPVYEPEPPRQNPFIGLSFSLPERGTIVTRPTEEYFPLSNTVFFDQGSTKISARYSQLGAETAKRFDEKNIENVNYSSGINRQGRISAQSNAYYHILNVYASRLRSNPSLTLKLVGYGITADESLIMGKNIKDYYVNSHGIDPNRIFIESGMQDNQGQKQRITQDMRRVEIEPGLPTATAPVLLKMMENSPFDNDILVSLEARDSIASWKMRVLGEKFDMSFGPFTTLAQRIEPTILLGTKLEGYFNATVTATKKDGSIQTAEKEFKLDRKRLEKTAKRFTVLFNEKESLLQSSDENYIKNKIGAMIVSGEKIIIHGHADSEGDSKQIFALSKKRAEYVRDILQKELKKRSLICDIQVVPFGDDKTYAMVSSALPEGKQYNRSAIIEIIPLEK